MTHNINWRRIMMVLGVIILIIVAAYVAAIVLSSGSHTQGVSVP